MAKSLMVKVLPCSIEMVISSLMAGLARKYRVGTTLLVSETQIVNAYCSPEVTKLVDKALELVKDLGVHAITRYVKVIDMRTVFLGQFRLDLFELQWLHVDTWSTVDTFLASDNVASERFGESTIRLPEVSLEEFHDGRWEIEFGSLVDYVLLREIVGNHELSEITDDLGRRGDFDDVSTESVGFNVLFLDIDPLGTESELRSLELQIGVLSVCQKEHPESLNQTHPPGISWSKTPESEARTLASKHWYNCRI